MVKSPVSYEELKQQILEAFTDQYETISVINSKVKNKNFYRVKQIILELDRNGFITREQNSLKARWRKV
jgi:predicted transcriptional regulator